jgi:riboflavin biosynthesis pyrimidine reductase
MGRLIVEQIVTADGYAADSDGGMKFIATTVTDDYEIDTEQLEMLRTVDAIVLGATTYRMFADYWPTASVEEDPVAEPINRLPKHVVSNTLDRAPWGDGEIAIERGDGVALLAAGVVDVLRLRVVPRLIGSGRGISPASLPMTDLTLTATHAHAGGQVTLQYQLNSVVE